MFKCLDRKIEFVCHLIDATEIVVGRGEVGLKRDRYFKQLDSLLVMVILNTGDGLVIELSRLVMVSSRFCVA